MGLFVGVMSNPTNDANGRLSNGFLSAVSSHCVGLAHMTTSASRTYDSGTGRVQYVASLNLQRKVGSALATSSGSSAGLFGSNPFGTKRYILVVRLQKGSGTPYTMTMQFVSPTTNGLPSNWPSGNVLTTQHLINVMLASSVSQASDLLRLTYENNSSSYQHTASVSTLSGINEPADGPLNAIHIAWGRVTPRLAISDICYVIKS
jgi:hypothetical protein